MCKKEEKMCGTAHTEQLKAIADSISGNSGFIAIEIEVADNGDTGISVFKAGPGATVSFGIAKAMENDEKLSRIFRVATTAAIIKSMGLVPRKEDE